MDISTWDAVFIRAPRTSIHPVVADLESWAQWWPGLSLRPYGGQYAVALRAPGPLRPVRRWNATVVKNRRDLGIDLRYRGDLTGEAEFYYLDETAGTVVHYIVRAQVADRRWRAAVRDHRAGVRAALDALKDRFERNRLPGEEPDAALLVQQEAAKVAFAEGVAAWERKLAAGQTAEKTAATKSGA